MWLSKQLEKRNKNLVGAERESKFLLDCWNGWALKWGWSSATSNYGVWEVRNYSSRLQIGTGGEIPVLCSWFVFNLSLISKIRTLCVVNLGKEGAVHSLSCVCPAWLCVSWNLKSWEAAFFSFFLSCKLLSSGRSSPSSGCASCILLTLLSKAQHGSELGRRRALDREDETFSGFTIRIPRWLSDKRSHRQFRRHGFDPWVRKIPWRRKWQPTPVFLPGKFHGQRTVAGYSPWGRKRVGHDLVTKQQTMITSLHASYFIDGLEVCSCGQKPYYIS